MSATPIILKRERSPTPPLTLEPKTSGVKLIAPIPTACQKSSPNYHDARKWWIRQEVKTLNALGLSVKKFFIREDGLALEWHSPVPVWPDTLKPANHPSTNPGSLINVEGNVVGMQDAQDTPHVDQPSLVDQEELERRATELEDLAIEYLRKYVRAFDMNRVLLASAYAKDALFSYYIHEQDSIPPNPIGEGLTNSSAVAGSRNLVKEKSTNNLYSGPSEIVSALLLLGPLKFCAHSATDLHWNVLAVPPQAQQGINQTHVGNGTQSNNSETPLVYLSSHGCLTEVNNSTNNNGNPISAFSDEKRFSFDQCFILRRPDFDPNSTTSTTSTAEWPLVAVNHQLTIRELYIRPLTP